jgi:hypothetical protein
MEEGTHATLKICPTAARDIHAVPTFNFAKSTWVGINIDLNVGDIRHPTSTSVIPVSEENVSD